MMMMLQFDTDLASKTNFNKVDFVGLHFLFPLAVEQPHYALGTPPARWSTTSSLRKSMSRRDCLAALARQN
jgi:hypothetical protein